MRHADTQKNTKTQSAQTVRAGTNPYAAGSRYAGLWESNPYTEEKMTQQQTVWDRFANVLGFRSAYDIARDQRSQAAAEYDAQIAQLKGEDEYNTPAAQAARMEAAGINPAITGGVEGGQAAEFAQEQTTPEVTPDENLTKIGSLMNGVAQAVTMASGMIETTIGAQAAQQTILGNKIDNYIKFEEYANKWFEHWTPDLNKHNMKDKPQHLTDEEYMESVIMDAAHSWSKQVGMTSNQQKQFHNAIQYRLWGDKSVMYDKWHKNEESRRKWGMGRGSRYNTSNEDDYDGIVKALQPLTTLYDDYVKFDSEAKRGEALDRKQYHDEYLGSQEALADNADNKSRQQRVQLEQNMNKAKADIMKNLTEEAQKGNKWAFFLTLILPVLFSRLEGAQVTGGSSTNAKGEQTSKSNWAF